MWYLPSCHIRSLMFSKSCCCYLFCQLRLHNKTAICTLAGKCFDSVTFRNRKTDHNLQNELLGHYYYWDSTSHFVAVGTQSKIFLLPHYPTQLTIWSIINHMIFLVPKTTLLGWAHHLLILRRMALNLSSSSFLLFWWTQGVEFSFTLTILRMYHLHF